MKEHSGSRNEGWTLTGHETRAVFDRYNIVNEADLSSAVAKLATFHAQGSRTSDEEATGTE